MSNKTVLLKTYLTESKSEDSCVILYQNSLSITFKSKVDNILLNEIKDVSLTKKKLIIPLVLGGIGTSFSMLALSAGWYHYQLNLGAIFLFFGFMYWGFMGRKALEINVSKHRYVYLLKDEALQVTQFLSFLSEFRINKLKRGNGRIFHISYASDWKIGEYSKEYSHPSLLEDGFIHCSMIGDVRKSYEIYFEPGVEVLLLDIDVSQVNNGVIHVDVPSRNSRFPHIHGPINKTSIAALYSFNSVETLDQVLEMYLYPRVI